MQLNSQWSIYLIELRRRLIICLITIGIIILPLLYFANPIYHFVALPLLKNLPASGRMIATGLTTPFFVPIKLVLLLGLCLAIPVILYHLWAFVAPALYQNEKRLIWPLILVSTGLFSAGFSRFAGAMVPVMVRNP